MRGKGALKVKERPKNKPEMEGGNEGNALDGGGNTLGGKRRIPPP